MKRLKDDPRPGNWFTKVVGGRYIVLCFDTSFVTPLTRTPIHHETVLGKVREGD